MAKLNFFLFEFLIITFTLNLMNSKIWSPEELSKEITDWNTLIDPESFISDTQLFSKIYNNYLKTNKIYDKTNVNLFIIPRMPDEYVYRSKEYGRLLIKNIMEVNPPADNGKNSHLNVIFAFKQNILVIIPSEKLEKILSREAIKSITEDVTVMIKNKKYTESIIYLFDKLDSLWFKYRKQKSENNFGKEENILKFDKSLSETLSVLTSMITLTVVIVGYCIKKAANRPKTQNFENFSKFAKITKFFQKLSKRKLY